MYDEIYIINNCIIHLFVILSICKVKKKHYNLMDFKAILFFLN